MMGEEFFRMWEFYLAISELSFLLGKHMNFQIQLTTDVNAPLWLILLKNQLI